MLLSPWRNDTFEAGTELAVLNPLESLTDQEMKVAKTTRLL